MKKSIYITSIVSLSILFYPNLCISGSGEKDRKISYTGGMFYGSAYYSVENQYLTLSRFSTGLGGRAFLNLSNSFRLGAMGGSSTVNYATHSYYRISSFGLSIEYYKRFNNLILAAGVYGGRGKYRNLHFLTETTVDYGIGAFPLLSPLLTVSYHITPKLSFMLTQDYISKNTTEPFYRISAYNFRLGVVFSR